MQKGSRDCILRGNVVAPAMAFVIGGAAFTVLVTAFVEDPLTPLIAAISDQPLCLLHRRTDGGLT